MELGSCFGFLQEQIKDIIILAGAPDSVIFADARAPAVLAPVPAAVKLADAGAPAVLAGDSLAVMLADAGAPAVLAPVPAAVMLADAGALAVLALSPLAVMLALVAPPLRCAHPLPLPFLSPRHPHPLLHRMVGLLPRRVAVSPLLAALAALSPLLPVPAPPPPLRLRHWTRPARGPLPPPGDCDRAPPPGQRSPFVPPPLARRRP